jgi:hypothetical protein
MMVLLVAVACLAVSTPLYASRTRTSVITMMKPKWTESTEPLNVPGRANVDVDRVVGRAREEGKRSDWQGANVPSPTNRIMRAPDQTELAAVTTNLENLSKDLKQHRELTEAQHNSLQQAMDERGSRSGNRIAEAEWRAMFETVERIQSLMVAMEATLAAEVEAAALAAALDREAIIEAAVEAVAAEREVTVQLAVQTAVQAALEAVETGRISTATAEAQTVVVEAAEPEAAERRGDRGGRGGSDDENSQPFSPSRDGASRNLDGFEL